VNKERRHADGSTLADYSQNKERRNLADNSAIPWRGWRASGVGCDFLRSIGSWRCRCRRRGSACRSDSLHRRSTHLMPSHRYRCPPRTACFAAVWSSSESHTHTNQLYGQPSAAIILRPAFIRTSNRHSVHRGNPPVASNCLKSPNVHPCRGSVFKATDLHPEFNSLLVPISVTGGGRKGVRPKLRPVRR